jgi:short-subunit dehydrogenase
MGNGVEEEPVTQQLRGPRVVVITGASGGIGAAAALEISRRGNTVVLVARRAGALAAVAGRCGPDAHPIVADMTDRAEVRRVVAETLARHGRLDAWLNNVGRGITRLPSELTDEDVDEMVRVNVKSALYGMQEVLPHFQARGVGHLINVSSMLGRIPARAFRSAYSGAKHFLNALTASLRAELRDTHPGIVVSLVSPGVVRTEFGRNAVHGGPDSRQLPDSQDAAEVAVVIANLLESRREDVYTAAGSRDRVLAYFAKSGEDP